MGRYQELLNTCIDIREERQRAEIRKKMQVTRYRLQGIMRVNLKQLSLNIDKFN